VRFVGAARLFLRTVSTAVPTTIPFRLNGLEGLVTVEYGVNDDPIGWGYGLLGLAYPPDKAKGFPVVQASIDYPGEGYAAHMGWIQVVRYRVHEAGEETTVFDVPPQLSETDCPYMAFGVRPTMFDAPSTTDLEVTSGAECFLVHSPDALMTRVIHAICGFKWGYLVHGGEVRPYPLKIAVEADWQRNVGDLQGRYPTWTFGNSWSGEDR
jgi:hypothetical protein